MKLFILWMSLIGALLRSPSLISARPISTDRKEQHVTSSTTPRMSYVSENLSTFLHKTDAKKESFEPLLDLPSPSTPTTKNDPMSLPSSIKADVISHSLSMDNDVPPQTIISSKVDVTSQSLSTKDDVTSRPSNEIDNGSSTVDNVEMNSPSLETSTTTSHESKEAPKVNFLTLLAVVAIVTSVFVVCLLVTIICPHDMCCRLRPTAVNRFANVTDTSNPNAQQEAKPGKASQQEPVILTSKLTYHHEHQQCHQSPPGQQQGQQLQQQQQQQYQRHGQQRSGQNIFNFPAVEDDSIDSEMSSGGSDDVINLCCFGFQPRASHGQWNRIDVDIPVLESESADSAEKVPTTSADDGHDIVSTHAVEKYRKLIRYPSETTIKSREENSSGRVSVAESDSDNLSKELCSGRRKNRYRISRQRRMNETDVDDSIKESNIDLNRTTLNHETYRISERPPSPRPEYFLSQCPYCSCSNLMVNPNMEDIAAKPHTDSELQRTDL